MYVTFCMTQESSTDTTEAGDCPSDRENQSASVAGIPASSMSGASGLLSPSSRVNTSASVDGTSGNRRSVSSASRNINTTDQFTKGKKLLAPTTAPATPIQLESPAKSPSRSLQLFCTSSPNVEP